MTKKQYTPLHEQVASQIIKKLQEGTAPWQLPWDNSTAGTGLPYNAVTGNRYKGLNCISLMLAGRPDPRWLTYRQAVSKGWNVRKGEKGSQIQFVKTSEFVPKIDGKGNKIIGTNGKPEGIYVPRDRPMVSTAWVFNAQQIEGISPLQSIDADQSRWNPIARAEQLLIAIGAKINYVPGEQAFYNPIKDEITLPHPSQFPSADKFYGTAYHEVAHWSGHPSRLDRSIMNQIGSPNYAREELRSEIASMLIGNELKIGHDPGQHVAYVGSWVRTLRDTPAEIVAAATDAERIFDYIIAYERLYDKKQETASDGVQKNNTGGQQAIAELTTGQQINHHGSTYKVTEVKSRGGIRLENLNSGVEISVSKEDPFYTSLVQAASGKNKEPSLQPGASEESISR